MNRTKRRLLMTVLVVITLVLGVAYIAKVLLGTAAEGSVVASNVSNQLPGSKQPITVQGTYGSFTIPGEYTVVPTEKPTSPQIELFDYVRAGTTSGEIAVQVVQLANGTIDDDGTYTYRKTFTDRYTQKMVTINGKQVPQFTATQELSVTVYLQQGNRLVRISTTGNEDANEQVAHAVASSWSWR